MKCHVCKQEITDKHCYIFDPDDKEDGAICEDCVTKGLHALAAVDEWLSEIAYNYFDEFWEVTPGWI